jgi:ribosome maturation factor RimP
VEAIWRTDHRGWVLHLTVERPESSEPGAGVTLDLCADVSRDVSAALDVLDVVPGAYRLEVGSPGVERRLYSSREFQRFAGHLAKVRSSEPVDGELVHRGVLAGTDDDGRILIDTERGVIALDYQKIVSGQLILDPSWSGHSSPGPKAGRKRAAARR